MKLILEIFRIADLKYQLSIGQSINTSHQFFENAKDVHLYFKNTKKISLLNDIKRELIFLHMPEKLVTRCRFYYINDRKTFCLYMLFRAPKNSMKCE